MCRGENRNAAQRGRRDPVESNETSRLTPYRWEGGRPRSGESEGDYVGSARDGWNDVVGCDIVTTATNSNEPVFDGEWVEPGTHVNTMIGSDSFVPRRETDDRTVEKSDIVVVNSLEPVYIDKQPELYPHLREGRLRDEDVYELPGLFVKNRVYGRSSATQITYHNNNVGMGIQFAALGRVLYEKAVERNLGTPVPAELFMQYDDDLIAVRDQELLHMDPEDAAEEL